MKYLSIKLILFILLCQVCSAETYVNEELHFQMDIPDTWQVEKMKAGEIGDLSIYSESERLGFLLQLEKVHREDPVAVLQWLMSGQKTPSKPQLQSFPQMKAASAIMEDSQGVDSFTTWWISGKKYSWSLIVPLKNEKCSKVFLTLKELP